MNHNYDSCIICGTSMSPFSRHQHMSNGWVASLCSICREELKKSYGEDMSGKILGKDSLVDKMINAYENGDLESQDGIISEIIDLIEDILDKKSSMFI